MKNGMTRKAIYEAMWRNPLVRRWIVDLWAHHQGITGVVSVAPGAGPHDLDIMDMPADDGSLASDEVYRRLASGKVRVRRRIIPALSFAAFCTAVRRLMQHFGFQYPEELGNWALVETGQLAPEGGR
jgi:hypothetical protein